MKNKFNQNQSLKISISILAISIIILLSVSVSAADFVVHNNSNTSQIYFSVNGTTGNVTATYTGFFGFLGSIASRITKIFATDVDVSNNLNVAGNITGSNFNIGWTNLTDYPATCGAGFAIQQIGDTLTCVNISAQGTTTLDGYDSTFFMPLNTSVYGNFSFNGGWQGGGLSIQNGDIYAQTGYFYNISSLNVTQQNLSIINDLMVYGNTWLNQNLTIDTNTFFLNSNTNMIGLGTTFPTEKLQVLGNIEGEYGLISPYGGTGSYSNFIANSENLNAATWTKYQSPTVTSDATTAPDNTLTADFVQFNNSLGQLITDNIDVTSGQDYTLSIWMKGQSGGEIVQIDLRNTTSGGIIGKKFVLTTAWQRYSQTITATATTTWGFQIRHEAGLGNHNVSFWGAQFENSSITGPYIQTTGSAVDGNKGIVTNENLIVLGNTGIGTTTPQNTLNVVGSGNITGLLSFGSLASGVINTTHILDSTILTGDIANLQITAALIALGVVNTTHILDSTILTGDISADTILAADIATGGVATAEILDGTILDDDIAAGQINTTHILDSTILTGDILDGTILEGDIAQTSSLDSTEIEDIYLFNTGDTATGNYTFDSTTFHIDSTNNRVGIGTTSPTQELEVNGSLKLVNNTLQAVNVTFDSETTAGLRITNQYGYVSLTPLNTGWAHMYTDRSNWIFQTASTGAIYSYYGNYDSYRSDLTLRANGTAGITVNNMSRNVGIGMTSPLQKLHVNGSVIINGTLDMGSGQINNLANGTSAQDAITLAQLLSVNSSAAIETNWNGNFSSRTGTGNVVFSTSPTITSPTILTSIVLPASQINTTHILDSTILTGDIAAAQITAALIAAGVINTTHILDSTILSIDIANGTIAAGDIAVSAINTTHILDSTILTGDIATLQITAALLALSSVNTTHILDATILEGDIAQTSSLDSTEIEDIYLFNTGDTATGNYTFDSGTLFIDSLQDRIGIGIMTPLSLLHLNGTSENISMENTAETDSGLILWDANDHGQIGEFIYGSGDNKVKIRNNGIEAISVDVEGNISIDRGTVWVDNALNSVGINTTLPQNTLNVVGTVNITGATYLLNSKCPTGKVLTADATTGLISCISSTSISGAVSGAGTATYIPMWNGTNSLNNSVMYQLGSNIGIGTTTPQNILNVIGDANVTGTTYLGTASTYLSVSTDGYLADADDAVTINDGLTVVSTATFNKVSNESTLSFPAVVNDAGSIIHREDANQGRIYLLPSDDASGNDYVAITNTSYPRATIGNEDIRLYTSGISYFRGNMDVANGLDVTGAAITGSAGLTISAGTVSLPTDQIDSIEILNGTIAAGDIAVSAINTTHILDSTILTGDISADTILAADIATGGVATAEILDGTILDDDIAASQINTTHILDGTILTGDIANLQITSALLALSSVNTTHILDGTILEGDIAQTSSLDETEIADIYLLNTGDTASGDYNFDSNTFFIDSAGNEVGIGTATPTANLHIYSSANNQIILNHTNNMTFAGTSNIEITDFIPSIELVDASAGAHDFNIFANSGKFFIANATGAMTSASQFVLDGATGYVGIGTATPQNTLNVVGDLNVTGTIYGLAATTNLAPNSVNTSHIVNGTIAAGDIAVSAINTTHILDSTILTGDIAAAQITAALIAAGVINTTHILDSTILSIDIANGTIAAGDIAVSEINTTHILDSTILTGDISTDTILAADIATGGVATAEILDGTILDDDIAPGQINTTHILDGTILTGDIANLQITAALLALSSVNTTHILDGTILAQDLAPNSVNVTHTGDIFLLNTGDTGSGNYTFDTTTFHIDSSADRVGIGTTSPDVGSMLHVEGNITIGGTALLFEDSTAGGSADLYRFINFNNNDYYAYNDTSNAYSWTFDSATPSIVFDDGNVGIGTSSPEKTLHVLSTTYPQTRISYDSTRYLDIGHGEITGQYGSNNNELTLLVNTSYGGAAATNGFVFSTANGGASTERVRITKDGKVGIGTATPQNTLNVVGDANVTGLLLFGSLLSGAINTTHILDSTILTGDISADTILAADIATGGVATAEILDGTILDDDIAAGQINTTHILDSTILTGDIANLQITAALIALGVVNTTHILDSTILTGDISADTILAADIATGGVATAEILDGTILDDDIAAGQINTTHILDSTILTGDIANLQITAALIALGVVNTTHILDSTILTGDISADTILAADIATGGVATAEILDGTILDDDIAAGQINTTHILDSTILTGDILDGTILAQDLAPNSVNVTHTGDIFLLNTGDTGSGNYTFDTTTFHIDSSADRVGIGTAAPTAQLHLAEGLNVAPAVSGSAINSIVRIEPSTTDAVIDMGMLSSPAYGWIQPRSKSDYTTNYDFVLNPNGGNVGIATTTPLSTNTYTSTLTVNGSIGVTNVGAIDGIPIYLQANVATIDNSTTVVASEGRLIIRANNTGGTYQGITGVAFTESNSDSRASTITGGRFLAEHGANNTVANMNAIRASLTLIGGNSSNIVTNAYTIKAEGPNIFSGAGSITNAYSLHVTAPTSGTNKWSIYQSGTEDNYFAGDLGIGVTVPQSTLNVVGTANITSNTYVGGDLNVDGGEIYDAGTTAWLEVSGCGANTGVSSVSASGTITCTADTGTGTMSSWTLGASAGTNQSITDGNTATLIAGNAITTTAVATDGVTIAVTAASIDDNEILQGSIDATEIAPSAINTTHILDGTILTGDIANLQITSALLALSSVNTTHILDGTILEGDIAQTSSLDTTEIADIYLLNTGDTASGDYTFDTTTFFIDSANDEVGVGTTSPDAKFEVQVASGSEIAWFTQASGHGIRLQDTGNVARIGANAAGGGARPLIFLGQNISFWTGTGYAEEAYIDVNGNWDFNNNTLSDVWKLTLNTGGAIDPPYRVGDDIYATWAPFMVGQKEEVSGTIESNGTYVIDFTRLEKGSDLWLFNQVTDFGKKWENLQVVLTPGFDGRVWYKKDPVKKTLTIYGSSAGEVSYRLTGNSFAQGNKTNIASELNATDFPDMANRIKYW